MVKKTSKQNKLAKIRLKIWAYKADYMALQKEDIKLHKRMTRAGMKWHKANVKWMQEAKAID